MVFSSSREVYGDPAVLPVTEDSAMRPKNVYGASKAAGELFLTSLGPVATEIVIVRLANSRRDARDRVRRVRAAVGDAPGALDVP